MNRTWIHAGTIHLVPVFRVHGSGRHTGESDRGMGLKNLVQQGDAGMLAAALQKMPVVKMCMCCLRPVPYPGAGNTQFNLGGNTSVENKVIGEVPNPNAFTTLPAIKDIIKVTIQ